MMESNDDLLSVLHHSEDKPYQGHEQDWNVVMNLLELPLRYVPAVQEVLRQGRWKLPEVKNRLAYVRRSAKREALKMNIVDPLSDDDKSIVFSQLPGIRDGDGKEMSYQDALDTRAFQYDSAEGYYDSDDHYDEQDRVVPTILGCPVPSHLLTPEDEWPDAKMRIDWDKVANEAGLDDGERDILELRLIGFSRDEILEALAESREDRQYLQAAWKRLSRDFGRLGEILTGTSR